jgi:hypothetical protein
VAATQESARRAAEANRRARDWTHLAPESAPETQSAFREAAGRLACRPGGTTLTRLS